MYIKEKICEVNYKNFVLDHFSYNEFLNFWTRVRITSICFSTGGILSMHKLLKWAYHFAIVTRTYISLSPRYHQQPQRNSNVKTFHILSDHREKVRNVRISLNQPSQIWGKVSKLRNKQSTSNICVFIQRERERAILLKLEGKMTMFFSTWFSSLKNSKNNSSTVLLLQLSL